MSYSSGGPSASYVPPPPPASKRSPWLYVALGCGLTTLLVGGGCVAFVATVANRVKTEMGKPLDKTALMQDLGDTPIYPGAQLDEMQTKAVRASMGLMKGIIPADKTVLAMFSTNDPFDKIVSWYDTTLTGMGYKEKENGVNGKQHQYYKGTEAVILQTQSEQSGKYTFMLMRLKGVRGKM